HVLARWSGNITIPNNGKPGNPITFSTSSDDGSVVYIDNMTTPVVNNNFYQGTTTRQATVNLTPGVHTIDIEWYNGGGGGTMYFNWDPTGGTLSGTPPAASTLVPNSAFSQTISPAPTGSNDWSDPAKWKENKAPASGDTLVFDTTTSGFKAGAFGTVPNSYTPNNDLAAGLTLNGIIMNSTPGIPWSITGNAVTINNTSQT